MNRDNKSPLQQEENRPKERINLNDYYRKDDSDILKQRSSNSRESVERSLNEPMSGGDDTVPTEPDNI
jgi:hypothetical protein